MANQISLLKKYSIKLIEMTMTRKRVSRTAARHFRPSPGWGDYTGTREIPNVFSKQLLFKMHNVNLTLLFLSELNPFEIH